MQQMNENLFSWDGRLLDFASFRNKQLNSGDLQETEEEWISSRLSVIV